MQNKKFYAKYLQDSASDNSKLRERIVEFNDNNKLNSLLEIVETCKSLRTEAKLFNDEARTEYEGRVHADGHVYLYENNA